MKIIVTGGTGLLGSEFRSLDSTAMLIGSKDLDLLKPKDVMNFFLNKKEEGYDTIIHCAAKVGGLGANINSPVDFFNENVKLNLNVLEAAHASNMKLVSILSTCIYPDEKFIKYPLTEDQLHLGPPHSSNYGYAYAKRMLEVQTRAYRQQFNSNFVSVISNNLYGNNDNYNLNSSHVIPALIRKFHDAVLRNENEVKLWGTGRPLREFTLASDAAKIVLWVAKNYNDSLPINIGNNEQISIEKLAILVANEIGYNGKISFNDEYPDGQFEKPSSNKLLRTLGCDVQYTSLFQGIKETVKFFKENHSSLKRI